MKSSWLQINGTYILHGTLSEDPSDSGEPHEIALTAAYALKSGAHEIIFTIKADDRLSETWRNKLQRCLQKLKPPPSHRFNVTIINLPFPLQKKVVITLPAKDRPQEA